MNGKTLALLAIGAAVVLLFTTKKGKEIREDIADTAGDWKDKLGDFGSTAAKEMNTLRQKLMEELEGLSSDVRDRIVGLLDESASRGKKVARVGKEQLS